MQVVHPYQHGQFLGCRIPGPLASQRGQLANIRTINPKSKCHRSNNNSQMTWLCKRTNDEIFMLSICDTGEHVNQAKP